jgi:hypothetical protein
VKTRLTVTVLLTVVLAACSMPADTTVEPIRAPVAIAATSDPAATPTAVVSLVAAAKPAPKPVAKAPVVRPRKVWPGVIYRRPAVKPKHFICYVGKPCNPPPRYWTLTIGCTGAWRAALHRTSCPPGQPVLP